VTIPHKLILTFVRSPPLSVPLEPLPTPLKEVARVFFVPFHIGI
jgi:hypothetical protein